jgi:hypothetical protein
MQYKADVMVWHSSRHRRVGSTHQKTKTSSHHHHTSQSDKDLAQDVCRRSSNIHVEHNRGLMRQKCNMTHDT